MIKMLYNRCMGVYKFGNNTYPQRIRRRLNLGHIFRGKKSASYGPGNTVLFLDFFLLQPTNAQLYHIKIHITTVSMCNLHCYMF